MHTDGPGRAAAERPAALARQVLHGVAPDADLAALSGDAALVEALGLDSMDFLAFADGLGSVAGVVIPDRDYPRLATLDGCARYLAERMHP